MPPAIARAFGIFDRFEMRHEGSFLHWLAEHAKHQIHDAADRESAIKRQAPGGKVRSPDDDALEDCLEQVSPDHRMVIVLRHYDGLAWREVAQRLGQTGSSVHELHRRALLELATMLRSRGVTPAQGEGAGSLAGRRTTAAVPAQSKTRRRVCAVWLLCFGITAIPGAIWLAVRGFPGSQ